MEQRLRQRNGAAWCLMGLGAIAILLAEAGAALAAENPQVTIDIRPGGNSWEIRQEALRAIPLDRLDPGTRNKVQAVLADACFFRRMPVCSFSCPPELYLYLVDHPDILVNIWQLLGITQLKAEELEPGKFHVVDAAGTELAVWKLYSSYKTHVFYSEGTYDGPLLVQSVKGRAVTVLTSGYVREPDGCYFVTSQLDVFMSVDRVAAEVLTRTLQPLLGKVADFNFTQTMAFLANLWKTTERNPAGVQRLAARLSHVRPAVREEFADLAMRLTEDQSTNAEPAADWPEQLADRPRDSAQR